MRFDRSRGHTASGGGLGIKVGDLRDEERLPPGRYQFAVDDAQLDVSRAGNDVLRVMLCVIWGEYEGATLRQTFSLAYPKRLNAFVEGIGLKEEFADDPDHELSTDDLVRREFEGEVVLESDGNGGEWATVYAVRSES